MKLDAYNTFSDSQAITATAASENELEFPVGNIGEGSPVFIYTQATETFTASGDATLTITLQDSADGSTWADVVQTAPIPKADLVAGDVPIVVSVPRGTEKFLRLNYTVASGPFTAGKLYAGLRWT